MVLPEAAPVITATPTEIVCTYADSRRTVTATLARNPSPYAWGSEGVWARAAEATEAVLAELQRPDNMAKR